MTFFEFQRVSDTHHCVYRTKLDTIYFEKLVTNINETIETPWQVKESTGICSNFTFSKHYNIESKFLNAVFAVPFELSTSQVYQL